MSGPSFVNRGFPGPLPAGETLLWQGAPDWRVLARTAMHVRGLAFYFGALAIAAVATGRITDALTVAALGLVPIALAYAYAYAVSRSTIYSITNCRVVLHIGLALPVTLNLPLSRVSAADLRTGADGSGDLSLTLSGADRFAYVVLWPHARPWRFAPAQPTMRGLRDAAQPAQVLARALGSSATMPVPTESRYNPMQTPLAA